MVLVYQIPMIIICSSYGERINTLNLKDIFKGIYEKDIKHWALFEFTSEEDLLLVSANGMMFIVDPMSGELKHTHDYKSQFSGGNMIESAKSEGNFVIIKTGKNFFYTITDIYHPELIDFGQANLEIVEEDEEAK
jgi:hypothetical protein